MPPKKGFSTKRGATPNDSSADYGSPPEKKAKTETEGAAGDIAPEAKDIDDLGFVLRKYYPPEMSDDRARAYGNGEIVRPAEQLAAALEETAAARGQIPTGDAVVHWFRRDLRTADNRGLRQASEAAAQAGIPLLGLYLVSPEDFEAHLTAPARVDFELRALAVLRRDLARLDIPLHVETVARRRRIVPRVLELAREWRAGRLFANMEYEVDELRRDARLVRLGAEGGSGGGNSGETGDAAAVAVDIVHDTCIVPPGALTTGAGRQYSVYTPW